MCIVLLTTAHPKYALVIIDNRDEYILRPTGRPHWWTHETGASILCSRDLFRPEQGTWLGLNKRGGLAVLTNYSEPPPPDGKIVNRARFSRGGMVTTWLGVAGGDKDSRAEIEKLLGEGIHVVGGFSMLCGRLRKKGEGRLEPLGIISNRCEHVDHVVWVGEERGEVYGLSNTVYDDPEPWPKVEDGKRLLKELAVRASDENWSEDEFTEGLFEILSRDTFPVPGDVELAEVLDRLRESIKIPLLGDDTQKEAMEAACTHHEYKLTDQQRQHAREVIKGMARPEAGGGFDQGLYGTQRQTVILVDWEGNVTMIERALWDDDGCAIPAGQSDSIHKFKVVSRIVISIRAGSNPLHTTLMCKRVL